MYSKNKENGTLFATVSLETNSKPARRKNGTMEDFHLRTARDLSGSSESDNERLKITLNDGFQLYFVQMSRNAPFATTDLFPRASAFFWQNFCLCSQAREIHA